MFAFAVPILAALIGATPAATLRVAPSPLASTLTAALQKELGAAAVVSKGGQAVARLTRSPGALELKVRGPQGRVLLRRQIRLNEEGERPAIRVAVLLLVEVYERLEQRKRPTSKPPPAARTASTVAPRSVSVASPPAAVPASVATAPAGPEVPALQPAPQLAPVATATAGALAPATRTATVAAVIETRAATIAPPAPPPETRSPAPSPRRWWLSVAASGSWWARPGTPTVGAQAGAHYALGRFEAGLRVGVGGLCCHLALPEADDPSQTRIEANPLHVWGLAEGRWQALSLGPVRLSPLAGIGLEWTQVRATATAFVGEPVQETRSAVAGLIRGGAVARVGLSARFALELGAGVQLRTPRLVIRLPEPFTSDTGDLDPGLITPWLEVGARFGAF